MVRRLLAAAIGALIVFSLCVAGSVLHRAHIVARVDGTSMWSALEHRPRVVLAAWRLSAARSDRLWFTAAGLAAGGLIFGRHTLIRFASSRRRTE